jgi:hypothetical protein
VIRTEDQHLAHIGVLRRSGRYPWGSGSDESKRNRTFLDDVSLLKKEGMNNVEIARALGITTTQLVARKSIASNQQKLEKIRQAQRLSDAGMSNVAIGKEMGINESSVRALLAPGAADKADLLNSTADMLRREVAEKKFVDIGRGVELDLPISDGGNLPISPDKLKTAVAILQEEGYAVHQVQTLQAGTGLNTKRKVLAPPGTPWVEVARNQDQIKLITEYSDNGGRDWNGGLRPPTSVSSKKIEVRYAEDGGSKEDGVIHLRPGAEGLSLGGKNYAQVRIAVDNSHYLKGMAVYRDDLPPGVDIRFNTNKHKGTPKMLDDPKASQVFKPMERKQDGSINLDNPFTASIKPGGQRGHLNIVNEEGDWDNWSRNLSSQILSKQAPALAKSQLNMTHERRQTEFDEISKMTNPLVRQKLLHTFADETDSAAVLLQAHALPKQANRVILPVNTVKPHEVYAPSFANGTRVVLIRHPHGGLFEIPELTVNNRNPEARKVIGTSARDAIGIHHSVAERLSGADFDGDHVLVIPNERKSIKTTPPLEGLKDFDPQRYKIPDGSGIPKITKSRKEQEMGDISNLITDMTIRGASNSEKAAAIRHSMVVIDSEKHGLDWRASAKDNGIPNLKKKYQAQFQESPRAKGGASTLISRAGQKTYIPQRKPRPAAEGGPIDKATGRKVFVETGRSWVDPKTGKTRINRDRVKLLSITDNAHKISSGTTIEQVYAEHSNKLKGLANQARLEAINTKTTPRSPSAAVTYNKEVQSLNAQLILAKRNAPLERHAQTLAQHQVRQRKAANPDMDADTEKKIRNQALTEARFRTGAHKARIRPTQSEWDAIQAGAISPTKLNDILNNSDIEHIKKLATPKKPILMSSTKTANAKALLSAGWTQSEVAAHLGVSLSTLKDAVYG